MAEVTSGTGNPSSLTPRTALVATFCSLLWSGAYVTGKIAIGTPDAPGFGPFRLAFFRFGIAGIVLAAWLLWRNRQALQIRREDYYSPYAVKM